MKLASEVVRNINKQKDKRDPNHARKAMIRTELSLNGNGNWEEEQLSPELQAIVAKHRNHFEGEPVHEADTETESERE